MASSENQGLQIALIIFVMLTIILSVTTFLFFREYEEAVACARRLGLTNLDVQGWRGWGDVVGPSGRDRTGGEPGGPPPVSAAVARPDPAEPRAGAQK